MKSNLLFIVALFFSGLSYSQQTVKGKVVDLESQFPLPGVNVQFVNGDFSSGVATAGNGTFKIENVPILIKSNIKKLYILISFLEGEKIIYPDKQFT